MKQNTPFFLNWFKHFHLDKTFSWYHQLKTLPVPKLNYLYICYPIFKPRWVNVESGNASIDEHINLEILSLSFCLVDTWSAV